MAKKERKFQEVKSDLPPVWEPEAEGEVLEGIFLGTKMLRLSKTKEFKTHQIQSEETGEVLSFSGAISDRLMGRIPSMTYVRVTYLGKVKTGNGMAKNFKVEADESAKLMDEEFIQGASNTAS